MRRYSLPGIFIVVVILLFITFSVPVKGAAIKDSESATHGKDASDYSIVDTYDFGGLKVIQLELSVLSTYSYILLSDGDALVVDPGRDTLIYHETVKKHKATIKGVYLSHSHADFVAGHIEIAKQIGCPIYQSHKSGAKYPIKVVDEASTLSIGKATLRFIDTPGHTPDGMCALVYGPDDSKTPVLTFTGDVLFVGSVGRPDLLEGQVSAAWLASAMFDSWHQKIAKLGDSVRVFPAHGAGSLCGAHLSDEPYSTIGKEKASNAYLKYSNRNEFVAALLQDLPEAPQYFKHNAAMNRNGPDIVQWEASLPTETTPRMELSDPKQYYVVDTRDPKVYAEGHIPNSVNIGLRGRFETWAGIMVPWEANLIVVGDPAELKEAVFRLNRIGYKTAVLSSESWQKAGLPLKKTPPISPQVLYGQMQAGTAPVIIDVRLPNEWMALRIGTVLNMPLNQIDKMHRQLDPQEPVVAVCNSAYRSSLAVGVFERNGFEKPMSLEGGSEAWINASLPVFETAKKGQASSAASKRYIKLPERISPADLKRMMMDLPGTFDLIDIRPPEHFSDFNLPGSLNADIAELIENPSFLVGNTPLIVVCRDGSLSMAVAGILSQKTQRPIKVLFGGVEAFWETSSENIENLPKTPPAGIQKSTPKLPATAPTPPPAAAPPTQSAPKRKSAGC